MYYEVTNTFLFPFGFYKSRSKEQILEEVRKELNRREEQVAKWSNDGEYLKLELLSKVYP